MIFSPQEKYKDNERLVKIFNKSSLWSKSSRPSATTPQGWHPCHHYCHGSRVDLPKVAHQPGWEAKSRWQTSERCIWLRPQTVAHPNSAQMLAIQDHHRWFEVLFVKRNCHHQHHLARLHSNAKNFMIIHFLKTSWLLIDDIKITILKVIAMILH